VLAVGSSGGEGTFGELVVRLTSSGVRGAATAHMLDELCGRSVAWIDRSRRSGSTRMTADVRRTIEKQRRDLSHL